MQIENEKGKLQYFFDGNDAPVNGAWVDKISGIRFVLYKNNTTSGAESLWNQAQGWYEFEGQNNNYAQLYSMNDVDFNWGHHWRLEFDLYQNGANSTSTFWDLGSVGTSNKAMGFMLIPQNVSYPQGTMGCNWKLLGNNSNPGIMNVSPPGLAFVSNGDQFVRYTGSYSILDGGDGYDRMHRTLNNYSDIIPVQVPKVKYGPTWKSAQSRMGKSIYSIGYYSDVKIRSLKVYVID